MQHLLRLVRSDLVSVSRVCPIAQMCAIAFYRSDSLYRAIAANIRRYRLLQSRIISFRQYRRNNITKFFLIAAFCSKTARQKRLSEVWCKNEKLNSTCFLLGQLLSRSCKFLYYINIISIIHQNGIYIAYFYISTYGAKELLLHSFQARGKSRYGYLYIRLSSHQLLVFFY